MKDELYINGLRINNRGQGIITCDSCEQILGYLTKEKGMIFMHISCRCGNEGCIHRGNIEDMAINEKADFADGRIVCPVCNREIMNINDRVTKIGFKSECECGHVFDSVYERKREFY